jgi:hypothetical protein
MTGPRSSEGAEQCVRKRLPKVGAGAVAPPSCRGSTQMEHHPPGAAPLEATQRWRCPRLALLSSSSTRRAHARAASSAGSSAHAPGTRATTTRAAAPAPALGCTCQAKPGWPGTGCRLRAPGRDRRALVAEQPQVGGPDALRRPALCHSRPSILQYKGPAPALSAACVGSRR